MGFFSSAADPFGLFGDGQSGMDMMGMGGGGGGMGGMMNPMGMLGGLFGGGDGGGGGIFGSKPIIPRFRDLKYKPGKWQKEAIKDNLKAFNLAKKQARRVNVFNQAQLKSMLKKAIPQYTAMTKAGSQRSMDLLNNPSFASMLRGEIPLDVQQAVQTNAAAQAIGGGYGGSGMHRNLVARDLGLTSLDMINNGARLTAGSLDSAERWMASSKALAVPAQSDPASMFLSPQQRVTERLGVDSQNLAGQWSRDWLASQVTASPDPAARGAFDTAMGVLGMITGIYSGGPGYQNYYRSPWHGGGGGQPTGGPGGGGGGGSGLNPNYLPNGQPNWSNTSNTAPGYGTLGAMQTGIGVARFF